MRFRARRLILSLSQRESYIAALRRRRAHVTISGLQQVQMGKPKQVMSLKVHNQYSPKSLPLPSAFISLSLTAIKMGQRISKRDWKHIRGKFRLWETIGDWCDNWNRRIFHILMRDVFRHERLREPIHRTMLGWVNTGVNSADNAP
jgi:hypothetical protein